MARPKIADLRSVAVNGPASISDWHLCFNISGPLCLAGGLTQNIGVKRTLRDESISSGQSSTPCRRAIQARPSREKMLPDGVITNDGRGNARQLGDQGVNSVRSSTILRSAPTRRTHERLLIIPTILALSSRALHVASGYFSPLAR
jgi:hypothetical protein